ncbi:restriction endonuclease subunit S [Bacteroidota bacterium]
MNYYESYKNTNIDFIGKIPSGWSLLPLFTQCFPTRLDHNGEKTVLSLSYGRIVNRDIEKNFGLLPNSFDNYQLLLPDFVVLRLTDLQNDKRSLRVGYCETRGIITPVYLSLGCQNSFLGKYLYYQLHTSDTKKVFYTLGGGLRQTLRFDEFKRFPLVVPTIPEQHQIVEFLDRKTSQINTLIEKKLRKIDLLKEYRTSLINHFVTKGLNPNVEMKDSGVEWIGEIPKEWNIVSLKYLVGTKITDGPHETPEFYDNGIPFLSVESVQDNKLDFNKKRGFISNEQHEIYSKKCKPMKGDIFIVKSGSTTGKSTIVETDENFNIWSPICIVRPNQKKIISRFIFCSVQSWYFRRFIELGWSFGTQPNIGMGVIENIRLIVPPIPEQRQIVEFLDRKTSQIDTTIQMETKKIELLIEYRQSLISEVVTGKIDVRTETNYELHGEKV